MKKYLNTDSLLLLLTIIGGSFLRFYHYGSLPYSFDEFSALSRTHFTSFKELIQQGVLLTDTHPAGIQVFLYYWVKLVGYSEQWVKLPFILAGIGSIYLIYKIAESWFNTTVALLSAMSLAFLQYPVMLSQFARPYASGLFFGLLMIWYWNKAFIQSGTPKLKTVIAYVLASALCAYDHHFTLFLLALVWFAGIPFIIHKNWKTYVLSGIAVFLLYIPHLKIFFAQLAKGGVEDWLGKPKADFFIDYFRYIFHFSPLLLSVFALLVAASIFWRSNAWQRQMKFRWLIFTVVIVTWATAYFYSEYRSAILQSSVLIFTFPLLMIGLYSFFENIPSTFKVLIFAIYGFISIFTLAVDRQHYRIMYQSGYREVLNKTDSLEQIKGKKNVLAILDQPLHIQKYYLEKLKPDLPGFKRLDAFTNIPELENYLANQGADYCIIGWNNPQQLECLSIAKKYYPMVIEHRCYFLSDFYVLARNDTHDKVLNTVLYSSARDDKNNKKEILVGRAQEYYNLFDKALDSLMNQRNNRISIMLDLESDSSLANNLLVCEFRSGQKLILWQAANCKDFETQIGKFFTVYKTLKMADFDIDLKTTQLKIYLWNKKGKKFYMKNFKLEVLKGNPVMYGLYHEIE